VKKTLVFSAIIISVILVSGTIGYSLSNPEAFASGQGKGKDPGKGNEDHGKKGCETATEASEGKTKNPHCEDCEAGCEKKFDECIASGTNSKLCTIQLQNCLSTCAPPIENLGIVCENAGGDVVVQCTNTCEILQLCPKGFTQAGKCGPQKLCP